MTFLTLVRHGTTEWIEQGRLHGRLDAPLSPRGRQEAKLVAEALANQRFDAFYTSPLGRAWETAGIIGQTIGLEAVPLNDLREMDFGWLEGGLWFNIANDTPIKRKLRSLWFALIMRMTGESRIRFSERVAGAAREIARRHPDQRVLVVIHMAVRNNMLARLVDSDPTAWRRYGNWPACALTEIELAPDGSARIICLNNDEHLANLRTNP
jgi:broad specificity phosphatase PhoE